MPSCSSAAMGLSIDIWGRWCGWACRCWSCLREAGMTLRCSLGLRCVRDSLAAWKKFCGGAGNVRTIDLGTVSELEGADASTIAQGMPAQDGPRYFCCVAGVGLDGEVTRRANRLPRWLRGHGGYLLSLAPTIFTFAPLPMKILTPGQNSENKDKNENWSTRSDRPTLLAAFANTPFYGGGMKIAPQAKMDDGLLDVCVVGAVATLAALASRSNRLQRAPSGHPGGRILPRRAGASRNPAPARCLCGRRVRGPHARGGGRPSRRAEDCDAVADLLVPLSNPAKC